MPQQRTPQELAMYRCEQAIWAVYYLKLAARCAREADAPKTLARTRKALSSAKGAVRNANGRISQLD